MLKRDNDDDVKRRSLCHFKHAAKMPERDRYIEPASHQFFSTHPGFCQGELLDYRPKSDPRLINCISLCGMIVTQPSKCYTLCYTICRQYIMFRVHNQQFLGKLTSPATQRCSTDPDGIYPLGPCGLASETIHLLGKQPMGLMSSRRRRYLDPFLSYCLHVRYPSLAIFRGEYSNVQL